MSQSNLLWVAAGLLLLSAGCSMCAHPYDDCGPVYTDGDCSNCMPLARTNSILAMGAFRAAAPGAEAVPTPAANGSAGPVQSVPSAGDQGGPSGPNRPTRVLPPQPTAAPY